MPRPFWVTVRVSVPVAFWVAIRTATPSGAGNPCTAPVSEVPFSGRQGSGSGIRAASGRPRAWKAGQARLAEGVSVDAPSVLACALRSVLASVLESAPDRIPLRGGKAVHSAGFHSPVQHATT